MTPERPSSAPALSIGLGARLSGMMFLQYAIWGAWLPILYPFLLHHRQFTLDQTSWCLAAGALGAVFGPFLAGQLADRRFAMERLLAASHLCGAVLVFALSRAETFPLFLGLSAVYGLVYAPTIALTNALALAHIPDRDRNFGPVRLWGTIGWIAAGIAVGQALLHGYTPSEGTPEAIAAAQNAGRKVAFELSAALGVLMGLYCLTLPHTPPTSRPTQPMAWRQALQELRLQPLLTLFLLSIPVSVIHQFYFVYTSDFLSGVQAAAQSGAADRFAAAVNQIFGVGGGGLMTIGQMTEIAVLAWMPFLAKRLSRKSLLALGLVAYAARMALFAYAPQLLPVILGVALHGLCFGCFIFVAFLVVDEETSGEVRATAQNLFNLVFVGLGIAVGSWFAVSVVGKWASASGALDYTALFQVPMFLALACLAALLLVYPQKRRS